MTQAPNDEQPFIPGLEELDELPEVVEATECLPADNGYFSGLSVVAATDRKIEPRIALGRQKHNMPLAEFFEPQEQEPPEGASALEQRAYRLRTPEDHACYALRKGTVETVFRMIKSAVGFR